MQYKYAVVRWISVLSFAFLCCVVPLHCYARTKEIDEFDIAAIRSKVKTAYCKTTIVTYELDGRSFTHVIEKWYSLPGKFKQVDTYGMVIVYGSDGSWIYDKKLNTYKHTSYTYGGDIYNLQPAGVLVSIPQAGKSITHLEASKFKEKEYPAIQVDIKNAGDPNRSDPRKMSSRIMIYYDSKTKLVQATKETIWDSNNGKPIYERTSEYQYNNQVFKDDFFSLKLPDDAKEEPWE